MSTESKPNTTRKYTNRLISEKSPYLLQHAHNPVDWYPWGDEAFEKARIENKPVFLSIGYSTCHWCHVMERESFEDPEVARLMNKAFVSIKVDREERPDIDNLYMAICQIISGNCGWPLNIIMTHDKKPFFAGTYFPKESRSGRIGLLELIPQIEELWLTRPEDVSNQADEITTALKEISRFPKGEKIGEDMLKAAYEQLAQSYDQEYGGFGNASKFPLPHHLFFLLRYWRRTGDNKALRMTEKTLQSMRRGGIYDHIGFGFHRYSTDSRWLVPHFEKMLCDQALLAIAYTEAYQATQQEECKKTAQEIFAYVMREMRSPEGGFYSAEDAESEDEEGKFYVWTIQEIRQALGKEADLAIKIFNIEETGNFVEEASGTRTGKNILHLRKTMIDLAHDLRIPEPELRRNIESIRERLSAMREKRVHPHKDDKIL
nr:thioredoxin domain-containing protein [Candidatus Njordarchaeum guaymaensis]